MKVNKIIYVIVTIILIVVLGLFIFFSFVKKDNKKETNVVNIDCGDDCNENNNNNNNNNGNENNNGNSNNNGNGNENGNNGSSGNNGESGNNGSGSSNGNGGTGVDNGSGNNNGSSSGNGNGTPCTGSNCVTGDGTGNSSEASSQPTDEGEFTVSTNDVEWRKTSLANIFDVDKIAPGDAGTYEFVVNNNTKITAIYEIVVEEKNEYNANVLYKLKKNGEYVAGDKDTYVKYSELNLKDIVLYSKYKDSYVLEWKWVDADNDTEVGTSKGATYSLKITITSFEAKDIQNPFTGDKVLSYVLMIVVSIVSLFVAIIGLLINKKRRINHETI